MERKKLNRNVVLKSILIYRCRECKGKCKITIEGLIKNFSSVYQFSNGDLKKFILLLRRDAYPYEYINSWEKFDETTLAAKKSFYSNLNLENISDEDNLHTQKVWEVFEIRNLGEYHNLYVETDTLLLADVFENFRNMCLGLYWLDPVCFEPARGLPWQGCLKKTEVKISFRTSLSFA